MARVAGMFAQLPLFAIAACAVFALPAIAQEKDAARRLQQQMQKLQQTNSSLEKEKADLIKKLADSEQRMKELDTLKTQLDAARRDAGKRVADLDATLAKTSAERDRARTELESAVKTNQQQSRDAERLQEQVKAGEERLKQVQSSLDERSLSLTACTSKNQSMARSGREILDRLSNGTCAPSDVFAWDPVFQIGRLRYEQELETYRDRLDDDRYVASAKR